MKLLKEKTYKEKRSVFISYLFEVENIQDSKDVISSLKEKNSGAKHFLYALLLKEYSLAREDGEPVKSMSLLLKEMERKKLFNKMIVVIRYYGGVNLGASNLARVYLDISKELIKEY